MEAEKSWKPFCVSHMNKPSDERKLRGMICLDLDGTLFNQENEVTERNRQSMHSCLEKGLQVYLVTGRPYCFSKSLAIQIDSRIGAVSYTHLFLTEELGASGAFYVATEDGSAGTKGNVLDAVREQGIEADVIYACGPKPMLRAIKAYAEEKGIECYLSMEERMACGIGACLACVCQSKEKDEHSQVHNKRVCKDGPVFLSTEVEL